jgi:hypothetical protein
MAQPDLESFSRRMVAIKAESSEGTDANPSTSLNTFDLLNGSSGTEFDKIERPRDRSYFTGESFIVSNKRGFVEGEFEVCPPVDPGNAGATGNAPAEVVLFPCGMARTKSATLATTTYAPISTSIPTVTVDFYHSGTLKEIVGARGNISALAMAIGERAKANVRLEGVYTDVDEAVVPTDGDYSDFAIPSVATHANSVMRFYNSTASTALPVFLWGKSLSVDFGNTLQTKQYTQKRISSVSDRNATFTARFARPAKADVDVYALRDAGTQIVMDFTTVDDDGTSYTRLIVKGQIESISEVDIEGDFGYEISGPCIAQEGGGDEFKVEFGLDSLRLIGDLPDGEDGVAYSQSLTLCGVYGSAVTYSVQSGSLPTGLSLSSTTGVISGTPSAAATYTFVIRATTTDLTGAALTADSASQEVVIDP